MTSGIVPSLKKKKEEEEKSEQVKKERKVHKLSEGQNLSYK